MRSLVVALVLLLAQRSGHATDSEETLPPKVIAKRLFAEGRVLYDQGKFIEACVLFEKSYQLDPAVGTRMNLAECAEREGKPRAAWLQWIAAAAEFESSDDDRAKFARKRADALASKLATVVLRVAKPKRKGLTIEIAGRSVVPAAKIVERLDVSRVVIAARAPNREAFSKTVSVAIGETIEVEVPALARIGGQEAFEDDPEPGTTRVWWGLAAISSVVLVGGVAGTVYGRGRIDDIQGVTDQELAANGYASREDRDRDGEKWALRTNIFYGVAIGGFTLTTVFVVKALLVRRERRRAETAFRIAPVIAPQVAGVQLDLRW